MWTLGLARESESPWRGVKFFGSFVGRKKQVPQSVLARRLERNIDEGLGSRLVLEGSAARFSPHCSDHLRALGVGFEMES